MAYENTQAVSSVGQYKHGRAGGITLDGSIYRGRDYNTTVLDQFAAYTL